MPGERVVISGADLIEGWRREPDASWSAEVSSKPKGILRDGQAWAQFAYDQVAKRIVVKEADPRLHVFEMRVRDQGIDLSGKTNVQIQSIMVTNLLKEGI